MSSPAVDRTAPHATGARPGGPLEVDVTVPAA